MKKIEGKKVLSGEIKAAKGKKYYIKVRSYKIVNGKKIKGPWSAPKAYTR